MGCVTVWVYQKTSKEMSGARYWHGHAACSVYDSGFNLNRLLVAGMGRECLSWI